MAGSMYSMKHVGKTDTSPWRVPVTNAFGPRPALRRRNHVENRVRAYGGSRRSAAMPAVFSIIRRVQDPVSP